MFEICVYYIVHWTKLNQIELILCVIRFEYHRVMVYFAVKMVTLDDIIGDGNGNGNGITNTVLLSFLLILVEILSTSDKLQCLIVNLYLSF